MVDGMVGLLGWMMRAIASARSGQNWGSQNRGSQNWGKEIVPKLSFLIVLLGTPAIATASPSTPLFDMESVPPTTLTLPSNPKPKRQSKLQSNHQSQSKPSRQEIPLPFSAPGDLLFHPEANLETPNHKPKSNKLQHRVLTPPFPQPRTEKTLGQRVAMAAIASDGADVTLGPGRGALACAWAVNRFGLRPVLGRTVGRNPNLVVSVQRDLVTQGLAVEVSQGAAQPGDIVVAAGPGRSQHIGIVVSKRSGKGVEALSTRGGRWGWRSDLNFGMKYKVKGQIYRLKSQLKPQPVATRSVNPKPKSNPNPKLKLQGGVRSPQVETLIQSVPPLFKDPQSSQPQSSPSQSSSTLPSMTFTPGDSTVSLQSERSSVDSTLPNFPVTPQPTQAERGTVAVNPTVNPTVKPTVHPTVNQWFADRRSLGAVAIGHAEGNLSATGKIKSIYYGHRDPGNGVRNIGFCSLQKYLWKDWDGDGEVSFPEADRRCLELLRTQVPRTAQKLLDFGYSAAAHPEITLNCLDLYNQSRVAGRQCPQRYRQARDRGLTGETAYTWARVESFRLLKGRRKGELSASGLFRICRNSPQRRHLSAWNCIARDQRRRVRAIRRVLDRAI